MPAVVVDVRLLAPRRRRGRVTAPTASAAGTSTVATASVTRRRSDVRQPPAADQRAPTARPRASPSAHPSILHARVAPREAEAVTKWLRLRRQRGCRPASGRAAERRAGHRPAGRRWAVRADPRQNGRMSPDSPTARAPRHLRRPHRPRRRRPHLRDLQHQGPRAGRAPRHRPAALLHQGPAREPAAPRGQPARLGRRHRGRGGLGRQPRGPRPGRRRRRARDRLHARARPHAGLHRRARRRRPGRDARRAGPPGWRRRAGQPAGPRRARHRPLGDRRALGRRRRPTTPTSPSSTRATSSATSCCAGPRARSTASALVPPGTGICHQVNLEYLSRLVFATEDGRAFCDTLVGTDSHTVMVNGLGVLGWGVGGIEAEAAMLGQPLSMLLPPVVGLRISRRDQARASPPPTSCSPSPSCCATTASSARSSSATAPASPPCPLETRATIGNMSPEYGATCTMFPIDQVTLDYLRFTGRDEEHLALVEAYAKAQGLWHDPDAPEPVYSEHARARPGRRRAVARRPGPAPGPGGARHGPATSFRVALDRAPRRRRPSPAAAPHHQMADGDVVIAAITSCTNTSNPQVMVGAGPAGQEGGRAGPARPSPGSRRRSRRGRGSSWTTSSGPGLDRAARAARLLPRRLRLHDLHRQLGPAARRRQRGRAGGRPLRRRRALGQPQLRGPHPPRRAAELPGLAAARRGLRAGRARWTST